MSVAGDFTRSVASELVRRDASGAANAMWDQAAQLDLQPAHESDERTRMLLLSDRMATNWVPAAIRTLNERQSDGSVSGDWEISGETDIPVALRRLEDLCMRLSDFESGTSSAPAEARISVAIAPFKTALEELQSGAAFGDMKAALEAFAVGFTNCFDLGAFPSMPGEVSQVVTILNQMDRNATSASPQSRLERTAAEGNRHKDLVSLSVSYLSTNFCPVSHADGVGTMSRPPRVGRHRPDLLAESSAGGRVIGEVKLGPELFGAHTQEQLRDFLDFAEASEQTGVVLFVPTGWREDAQRAGGESGGETRNLSVVEIQLP